jgi:hypothetical protein
MSNLPGFQCVMTIQGLLHAQNVKESSIVFELLQFQITMHSWDNFALLCKLAIQKKDNEFKNK